MRGSTLLLSTSLVAVCLMVQAVRCVAQAVPETLPFTDKPVVQESQPIAAAAHIFVDVSRGVEGFLPNPEGKGGFASEEYVRLLKVVPDLADELTHSVSLHALAKSARKLNWDQWRSLQSREPYRCPSKQGCAVEASNVVPALESAETSDPSTLTVVVTLLSLGRLNVKDLATDVMRPLAAALLGQRSVGILGLKLPFSGKAYGVAPQNPYPHTGDRAVFVIAIGPQASVRDLLRGTAEKFSSNRREMILFSTNPVCKSLMTADLAGTWKLGKQMRRSHGLVRRGPGNNGAVQIELEPGGEGIQMDLDMREAGVLCPHVALPKLATTLEQGLWMYGTQGWIDAAKGELAKKIEAAGAVRQNGARAQAVLLGSWTKDLLSRRTYAYRALVNVHGVTNESSALGWLKEWTLEQPGEKNTFLKTPQLASFGERLLEAASQSQASLPVAQIAIVFQTD